VSGPRYSKVLITGASSGIGRAMALWWAARGATVYAAARRQSMLDELAKEGAGLIKPVALDVSKHVELVAKLQALDDEVGGLDCVIANAGVGDPTPAHLATWEMVERLVAVNVSGLAATITAVLPRMVKRGRGHVVGIASVAGYSGLGAYSGYSASKAFVSTFMQSLQVDLYGTGVKALCVEPGFVKSEMQSKLEGKAPMPFVMATDRAAHLIGRAIEKNTRRIAFPWLHAWPGKLISWLPRFIVEPMAQRASLPQVQIAVDYLKSLEK
jgi:short-subunit dehydrogenase